MTLVYSFDRLYQKADQVFHRTRANFAAALRAVTAYVVVDVVEVRINHTAVCRVNGVDVGRQMQFNAAALAERKARGTAGGPFDAPTTNLLANLFQILFQWR
jgi:hypothetical protein